MVRTPEVRRILPSTAVIRNNRRELTDRRLLWLGFLRIRGRRWGERPPVRQPHGPGTTVAPLLSVPSVGPSRTLLAVLTVLDVTACGGEPTAGFGHAGQAIIGGTADSGDPAVVAVVADGPNGFFPCSGVIVAPTVVLTAAHCANAPGTYQVITDPVAMQTGPYSWRGVPVSQLNSDPAFIPNAPSQGHDIAVVILASPTSIPPLPINRTALPASAAGQPIRLIGYGVNNTQNGSGGGTRRQVTTTVGAVSALFIDTDVANQQDCSGDDGGPALMTLNGTETIVGLGSYGEGNCARGHDTRVDLYTAFLDPFLPASPAPSPGVGREGNGTPVTPPSGGSTTSPSGGAQPPPPSGATPGAPAIVLPRAPTPATEPLRAGASASGCACVGRRAGDGPGVLAAVAALAIAGAGAGRRRRARRPRLAYA